MRAVSAPWKTSPPSVDPDPLTHKWKKSLLALVLFGVAFGYLEAAVVGYLRILHESSRRRFHPDRQPGDLFPLLTRDEVRTTGQSKTLAIEIGREISTMLMLAAVALAVAGNFGQWTAAFVIAFGVWDIAFYVFLKILLGWPASLLTWDILFLIPVPWVAPVLAPVLVAAAMVAGGVCHLWLESIGRRAHLNAWHAAGIVAGGLVIIVSFTLDYPNITAGGLPVAFPWSVFALGMAIGIASYAHAALRPPVWTRPGDAGDITR
jgi:hypothetical protein